jgi:hypothetical protein
VSSNSLVKGRGKHRLAHQQLTCIHPSTLPAVLGQAGSVQSISYCPTTRLCLLQRTLIHSRRRAHWPRVRVPISRQLCCASHWHASAQHLDTSTPRHVLPIRQAAGTLSRPLHLSPVCWRVLLKIAFETHGEPVSVMLCGVSPHPPFHFPRLSHWRAAAPRFSGSVLLSPWVIPLGLSGCLYPASAAVPDPNRSRPPALALPPLSAAG